MENKTEWYRKLLRKLNNIKAGRLDLDEYIDEVKAKIEAESQALNKPAVSGSLPTDTEIQEWAKKEAAKWEKDKAKAVAYASHLIDGALWMRSMLAVRCNLSKDDEIALYEKFLDEFTDKDGLIKPCNPDAIFNWFGWQLWRQKQ